MKKLLLFTAILIQSIYSHALILTNNPTSDRNFSESMSFNHNGPDEQKILQDAGSRLLPNFVLVESQNAYRNEINVFNILLNNSEPVKGLQFDIELPTGFDLDVNSLGTTTRTAGFTVAASSVGVNLYRVILYSLNSSLIDPGNDAIITLPVFVSAAQPLGVYQFNFTNVIISDINNQDIASPAPENGDITVVDRIFIDPKILLQGPYDPNTGLMKDELRSAGHIPTTSPYVDAMTSEVSVFDLGGTSGTGLPEDDIVDWVWVELRDQNSNTTILASKSALLQRDGDIVEVDGISNIYFDLGPNNYYVAVKHRNHLGVMSSSAIFLLKESATVIDFRSNALETFGSNARADLGSGTLALWAGNVNGDATIQYAGAGVLDTSSLLAFILNDGSNFLNLPTWSVTGYSDNDVDMNGITQYTGAGVLDSPFILQNILSYPGNFLNLSTWQIMEQLPEN